MPLVSFDTDFREAADAVAPYGSVFMNLIVSAVAKERERCACIAEAIDSGRGNESEIARAIRRSVGQQKPKETAGE